MKYLYVLPCLFICLASSLYAQITFRGCVTAGLGAQDYTLTNTGTTLDAGTSRNFFESTPLDFNQNCPAGVCEVRIIWNNSVSRWEIQLDNDGPVGTPDYTTVVLYYNTSASVPNPPDLTLGTWVDGTGGICTDAITTLSGQVQSAVTLPVELLAFSGSVSHDQVILEWQTSSELNNQRFEVERSIAGMPFETVGTVAGAGTSQKIQQYTFTDAAPAWSMNTYRLRQVDFNGDFTYSNRIELTLQTDNPPPAYAYPNPVLSEEVFVEYASKEAETLKISLLDMHGRVLLQQTTDVPAGNSTLTLPVGALERGMYVISLNGRQQTYLPVLRQ